MQLRLAVAGVRRHVNAPCSHQHEVAYAGGLGCIDKGTQGLVGFIIGAFWDGKHVIHALQGGAVRLGLIVVKAYGLDSCGTRVGLDVARCGPHVMAACGQLLDQAVSNVAGGSDDKNSIAHFSFLSVIPVQ